MGKSSTSGVNWSEGKSKLADNSLRVDLGMESKVRGIPKANQAFRVSVGAKENPNSQKMSSEWI